MEKEMPENGDVDRKVLFLQALLSIQHPIDIWKIGRDLTLIKTSSSCPALYSDVFLPSGCGQALIKGLEKEKAAPLVLEDPLNLTWIFASAPDGTFFLLGPALHSESPEVTLRIFPDTSLPLSQRRALLEGLKKSPRLSPARCLELSRMLHFCVRGEKLNASDVSFVHMESDLKENPSPSLLSRAEACEKERQLLQMVREGQLFDEEEVFPGDALWKVLRIEKDTPLQRARDSAAVFSALISRAAIEGGLSAEPAMRLQDQYTASIKACASLCEAAGICRLLLQDFARRVHREKEDPALSPAIRAARDYIDMHRRERLSLSDLAARTGYAQYYLSRKFKEETGIRINDYIRKVKTDEARFLLESTDQSIMDISIALNYRSRSCFSDSFRQETGLSPARYRTEKRKIPRETV